MAGRFSLKIDQGSVFNYFFFGFFDETTRKSTFSLI
jgi:hypothetical protein